ncbi:M28 family peptidase [Ammoniphilus sp. CFH 90114]|uniref:M28 family peptidase n=1 Tax=Ammoniphilus sp. CFH 90114 TaxID=2493665 RepID=UPI00100E80C0|nr:M28 family peptidase [Ammoniphilus sp. CFH 90114]RXT03878.1 M28 family peptidase [Ammoniphilus sp. CFH 90114]
MLKRRALLSVILAASLSFGVTSAFAAPPVEGNPAVHAFDNKVIKMISAENMYNNIVYLSQTPRVTSTVEEAQAAEYIKAEFEKLGLQTEIQEFQYQSYVNASEQDFSISDSSYDYKVGSFTYSPSGEVTSEIAYIGKGLEGVDAKGRDLEGKVALVERGDATFAVKMENAVSRGAVGVVLFNNADGAVATGTLGAWNDQYVPMVGITRTEGLALVTALESGPVVGTIKVIGSAMKTVTSQNVIATKPATQKDTGDILVISSHHDSVPRAPGANDNASGVAMTLELARVLANLPSDTEIRFVTFGSEEVGLVGSRHYARNLSENEKARMKGVFNLDMVGSNDAGDLVMYTSNGEKNTVTDLIASASSRVSVLPAYGPETRSDHHAFYEVGVPAALLIHAPLEPWYHTPNDTPDKISKEKLLDVATIVGSAVYQAARPDTPALERSKVAPVEVEYEETVGRL